MAGLLVKWTKVMINSNKNDITTCPQIGNIQVDFRDIQDSQFCTHIPQIKAVSSVTGNSRLVSKRNTQGNEQSYKM